MTKYFYLLVTTILVLTTSPAFAAVEDLSTFTIGGTDSGDITQTSARITANDPDFKNDDEAWSYKSYGASYFGEFDIDATLRTNRQGSGSIFGLLGFGNTAGYTLADMSTNSDGLMVKFQRSGTDGWRFQSYDEGNTSSVVSGAAYETRYVTITRSSSTCTLNVYTDSGRTTHASGSPVTVTCGTTKYQYLYLITACECADSFQSACGYVEDVEIIQADSGGASPRRVVTY